MNDKQRRIVTHEPSPFITAPIFAPPSRDELAAAHAEQAMMLTASREAAEREAAYVKALNPPMVRRVEPPPLRAPVTSQNLSEDVAQLDEQIFERGIAFNREHLISKGKTRFNSCWIAITMRAHCSAFYSAISRALRLCFKASQQRTRSSLLCHDVKPLIYSLAETQIVMMLHASITFQTCGNAFSNLKPCVVFSPSEIALNVSCLVNR
jgi:hypothetical protein